jgi:tRNA threonylcarbamoyladenosine biosynthesis protein TsaE
VAEPAQQRAASRSFTSLSEEGTESLAAAVGAGLAAGDVVALDGELGAGKTVFVRGLAQGLEVADSVSSPTYILMNAYRGRLPVYHFDAWMEGRAEAFLEDGGAEWMRADGVALVEWAERVADWLPVPRLEVHLAHAGPERRVLRLEVLGESGERWTRLRKLIAGLELPEGVEEP